jgi:hypothetical protein
LNPGCRFLIKKPKKKEVEAEDAKAAKGKGGRLKKVDRS